MAITSDIVDPQQVGLFDALEQLSALDVAHDIEIPQLVVMGDQSSGKSSVLEALVRSHFPVSGRRCTRFPIKLILRRSEKELLKVRVETSKDSKRTPQEKARMQEFNRSLEGVELSWDRLDDVIVRAGRAFGVASTTGWSASQMVSSAEQEVFGQFTEDILIIEKHGPGLPILSLTDLPGLFQRNGPEQDREKVARMVEQHVRLPKNIVLLVVSAETEFDNQTVLGAFQNVLKADKRLPERTIGVITHADRAFERFGDIQEILNDGRDTVPLKHGWHIVRNQSQSERDNCKSLDERDIEEEKLFNELAWKDIPKERKGIRNLTIALKTALWTSTQDALPRIILQVKAKTAALGAQVKSADVSRADDSERKRYLLDIAEGFQQRTQSAAIGNYRNKPCEESHTLGFSCRECKGFFRAPLRGDEDPHGQEKRLCSNIRGLNKEFALAMRRFGKTKNIIQSLHAESAADDEDSPIESSVDEVNEQRANQSDSFPPQKVILKHYTHCEPGLIDLKEYEEEVAGIIESQRGCEPRGEVSPNVYREIFLRQSQPWYEIATGHFRAVWEATERFVDLALQDVCADRKVLRSLQQRIIEPNLERLQKAVNRTLQDLIECHSEGNTGFYDSFGDAFTVQEQARDLVGRLDSLGWQNPDQLQEKRDEKDTKIRDALDALITSSVGHLAVENRIKDLVITKALGIVAQAFSTTGEKANGQAVRNEVSRLTPGEVRHLDAARVIGIFEAYYKTTMVAFVGYVNSLVIERGILGRLPGAILTYKGIYDADQAMINDIAAEDEDEVNQREENKRNLDTLRRILKMLEQGLEV